MPNVGRRAWGLSLCACVLLASAAEGATLNVAAGGNLQAALNAAKLGDVILLEAGAMFTGPFVLPAKGGTAEIVVRSSASDTVLPAAGVRISPAFASQLPKIRATSAGPAMRTAVGASYWRLQFLEFLPASSTASASLVEFGTTGSSQSTLASVAHHLTIDRCYLHGDPEYGQRRGLALNSASSNVVDSYFADFKRANQDTQAIMGWNGPGPFLIENNYIEAAAENVMFGGNDPSIPDLVPSNIAIRRNLISKPLAWRTQSWTVKNLVEFKNARTVTVEGNTIENNWAAGQTGYAFVITPRNQDGSAPWSVVRDIVIQNNVIRHVAAVFNILGYDDLASSQQTVNVTIRNNLAYDVSTAYGTSSNPAPARFALIGGGPQQITFDHNTVDNDGSATIYLYGGFAPAGQQIAGFVLTNNLLRDNSYAVYGDKAGEGTPGLNAYTTGAVVRRNTFASAAAKQYPADNLFPTIAQWRSDFTDAASADYRLVTSSLSRNAGTDGKDLGVDYGALSAATGSTTPLPTTPPPPPAPTVAPSGPPFGVVDTPANGTTGVTGSIAITGWALDESGVPGVKIYRNCLSIDSPAACQVVNGSNVVLIGDATFIAGARTDVAALYPGYPAASRAGWGYLLLTNMLPHVTAPANPGSGGQGPITLFAYATDVDNHRVLLGQRTITLDNDHGAKPFGAIDTPTQGGTASGIVQNYGWALTPGSAMIPSDGSTMTVVVDGVALGAVSYSLCRDGAPPPGGPGGCRDDVATLFPTTTNITTGSGAIGAFSLDTTKLTNGLHTIAWSVTDDRGRVDGIGSRFFTVQNGPSSMTANALVANATPTTATAAGAAQDAMVAPAPVVGAAANLAWRSASAGDVLGRAGFDFNGPLERIRADSTGLRTVRMPELGRVELLLGEEVTAGYLYANDGLRPLPPGSQLDPSTGTFTWTPGAGYIGTYDLVFLQGVTRLPIAVTIEPKSSTAAAQMQGWIDLPTTRATVAGSFMVAGWALDTGAWQSSGIGAVHVWAQRRDVPAASPIFLGAAGLGIQRPDVAVAFGSQFERAGWGLAASGLAPGTYDVTAYFWSTRTSRFEDARTVSISVR